MKYIAVAALLGAINGIALEKHHHKEHTTVQQSAEMEYRPNAVQSPWSVKKGKEDPNAKKNPIADGFPSYYVGWAPYEREPTAQFSNVWPGNDDTLMNSLIMKYSVEGSDDKMVGNGKFYMTYNGMERVSREVIGTHFGWTGAKRENYLKEQLPKLWNQWDVNRDGYITADRAPTFLRLLVDGPEIAEGLQVQTGEQINW